MSLAPSPTAARVVEILDFLAGRPTDSFTTSQLARALGQNRTTCQSVLLSLEEAGWVRRTAEKAYSLGSSAIVAGQAALAALPFLDDVEAELSSLHAEFGVEAVASVKTDDQMVVVARVGPDRTLVPSLHVGLTVPFVPPFGLAFVAWDDDAFERWLRRSTDTLAAQDVDRLRRAAAVVRGLGYCVTLDRTSRARLADAIRDLDLAVRSPEARARRDQLVDTLAHDEYVMVDIEHQADQPVSQISAPVFGADQRVLATLSVMAFPHELLVEDMPRVAERLRVSAETVTDRIHPSPARKTGHVG
ncbi:MAG TPA: helix-turn-helix domain-containing protein [Acidimicrobiales bacterium]|nr:helix-turn-helix domain-containing protein [Acidimicrobiales bacterium]